MSGMRVLQMGQLKLIEDKFDEDDEIAHAVVVDDDDDDAVMTVAVDEDEGF